MRNIAFISTLFFLVLSGTINAQEDEINSIRVCLKSGNYQSLSGMFTEMVDVKTDVEEGNYNKQEAEFLVKNFFRKYVAQSFEYNHIGSSQGGSKYMIGTYSANGEEFRVYIKLKNTDGQFLIDNINFTRQ